MNSQQIFNHVINHLKNQRKPALQPGGGSSCQYLTSDGLKCAVGCLIDDPALAAQMDNPTNPADNTSVIAVGDLLPEHLKPHLDLLDRLQKVHDRPLNYDRKTGEFIFPELASDLNTVALQFDLTFDREGFLS